MILFDGVCHLCSASVRWVLQRDKAGLFRFASLQSEVGKRVLERLGLQQPWVDSVILVVEERIYVRSDAALEIVSRLGPPWSFLALFRWVPKSWRDTLYCWIARNRYRWFGRYDTCWLPDPKWKARFMDINS